MVRDDNCCYEEWWRVKKCFAHISSNSVIFLEATVWVKRKVSFETFWVLTELKSCNDSELSGYKIYLNHSALLSDKLSTSCKMSTRTDDACRGAVRMRFSSRSSSSSLSYKPLEEHCSQKGSMFCPVFISNESSSQGRLQTIYKWVY